MTSISMRIRIFTKISPPFLFFYYLKWSLIIFDLVYFFYTEELGLAVRVAYECTDHTVDRHRLLVEAVFEKIVQDLGQDTAKKKFEAVFHG
jgi:hypothetical protein